MSRFLRLTIATLTTTLAFAQAVDSSAPPKNPDPPISPEVASQRVPDDSLCALEGADPASLRSQDRASTPSLSPPMRSARSADIELRRTKRGAWEDLPDGTRRWSPGVRPPDATSTVFLDGAKANGMGDGVNVSDCGNAFYDDGTAVDTDWFDGGGAGDPDKMFAVKFVLADFGYTPGNTQITGFCAANQMDWGDSGGPWPNEVFIYPAGLDGKPDDSTILGQGTIETGDGLGWYEVTLAAPVTLTGDFWLVNRGDPLWVGEDFNMDFDASSDTGHSFYSESGIANLALGAPGNYMLRATLQSTGVVPLIFSDGFESGDTSRWSSSVP